ncbi:Uu.00g142330.m01.CDS01 [Anthostomella pinea]|uniref:Uu.00g142330.m01.CDS01 n=1 Tax=Anthostomella pinea TaxID=933095 RepID=A0AAI8VRM6_9PEZI|nr:Uu.00g142330.m01.CDS01 [Anthostomella pinea]
MAIGKEGNVKWVDGLRGLASTLVVLTHIARAFDGDLFLPVSAEGTSPRLLQLPFLRILVQGRIGVTIFSFVTGYVCALKPIKLYRQNNQDAAFTSIAKSALRRVPRLVIPCAFATFISWIMAELGMFLIGKRSDCWWCGMTAPDQVPNIFVAFKSLIFNIINTWTKGANAYDGNQWTLLPLLRGSMQVYTFIIATSYIQPRYRMIASMMMYFYFYIGGDSAFGMQFFWGVFLCDVQNTPAATEWLTNRPKTSRLLAIIFLTLGLYVASYPEGHAEWATWSHQMFKVLVRITPSNPDFPRYASGIGLQLITLGLHFSPGLRDFLSSKYLLWLGKQSFAVYLLHGPLLRSVLCWMVYGIHLPPDISNENGDTIQGKLVFPNGWRLMLSLPFWIPLNYGVAMLWTGYVDPWCANLTEKIVSYVNLDRDEKGILLPQ